MEQLLKDERDLWQPVVWQAQVESVLKSLLNSPDAAARTRAESLANLLVESGSLFARDLLSGVKTSSTSTISGTPSP